MRQKNKWSPFSILLSYLAFQTHPEKIATVYATAAPASVDPRTIDEVMKIMMLDPHAPILKHKDISGNWITRSIQWLHQKSVKSSQVLRNCGLEANEGIAIIASNSVDWELLFYGSLINNSFVLGIDPRSSVDQINEILKSSNVQILAVDKPEFFETLPRETKSQFKNVILLNSKSDNSASFLDWNKLLVETRFHEKSTIALPESPAILIYSSGTSGKPKGILYSQKQLFEAAHEVLEALGPIRPGEQLISWLPTANLFQRIMNICGLLVKTPVGIVNDPVDLLSDMSQLKPTMLIGVPRFFEKVMGAFENKPKVIPPSFRKLLFPIITWILRRKMGGKLDYLISGSAPLSPSVQKFFERIGLPILEAYGLSECIVPIAINTPLKRKMGSVGRILKSNTVVISPDKEILIKGPGLASQDLNKKKQILLDENGFYHTGDLGYIDEDGFLFIKGRISEVLKLSSGRSVTPSNVEHVLKSISAVDAVIAVGHGKKHLLGILVLKNPLNSIDLNKLKKDLFQVQKSLATYEQVRGFLILTDKLTIETGHLTTTLKLRRNTFVDLYRKDLNELYNEVELHPSQILVRIQSPLSHSTTESEKRLESPY